MLSAALLLVVSFFTTPVMYGDMLFNCFWKIEAIPNFVFLCYYTCHVWRRACSNLHHI
ncbi:hypothetical protein Lalb_Chr16g0387751 [Lupinus albus]|uniref:Uncharacterized protein n=1 Tax=Lupinus albus TaxID=3870 RepID=A0A6A4P6Y7_LUPAL|nr:hypothetical protein Lalb_Chr16g0387751 [Lupinus albus]